MVTNNVGPREALRQALATRAEAERNLEGARAASDRARTLLQEITAQEADLASAELRSSTLLADRMKDALKRGEAPSLATDREPPKSAVSRFAIETRRAAGEHAVAALRAEETNAEAALKAATEAVGRAVEKVLLYEAEAIGAAWEALDAQARKVRIRLGGNSGDPIWNVHGFSTTVGRAIYQNREDSEFDRSRSEAMSGAWKDFKTALRADADAPLTFAAADHAIAEMDKASAEHKARGERIDARWQGKVA